jgi:NAD(P)-dependent dehydrogenase (short-subunit alcohol dehydrogenase family)
MRRRVDAACKTRGDDEAFKCEIGGELARKFLADGGTVAGADDSNDEKVGEVEPAIDKEKGRSTCASAGG